MTPDQHRAMARLILGNAAEAERTGQSDGGKNGTTSRGAGDSAGAPRQLGDPALAARCPAGA